MLILLAQQDDWWIMFAPYGGFILSVIGLVWSLRSRRLGRLMSDTPTSKTIGVFIGFNELKGTAESAHPLQSELAEIANVHYRFHVEERWSRLVTERYTDSEGNTRTRTRRESGWTNVRSGGESQPFYLEDDYGRVLVRPEGAKIDPELVFSATVRRGDPLYYGKGPVGAVADSDHVRRFTEWALPLHHRLYVLGQAREREDVVAAEIAADPNAPTFLVSVKSEEELVEKASFDSWVGLLVAVAATGLGLWLYDSKYGETRAWLYILAGIGFGVAWVLGAAYLIYSSLIELRNRVRQAETLIDVQLMRRHDLIPNLVEVTRQVKEHTEEVQTAVASLRATARERRLEHYEKCGPLLHVLRESYPDLASQESFLRLQRELVETEDRIALARNYYNEVVSFYLERRERIPDRYFMALLPQGRRLLVLDQHALAGRGRMKD